MRNVPPTPPLISAAVHPEALAPSVRVVIVVCGADALNVMSSCPHALSSDGLVGLKLVLPTVSDVHVSACVDVLPDDTVRPLVEVNPALAVISPLAVTVDENVVAGAIVTALLLTAILLDEVVALSAMLRDVSVVHVVAPVTLSVLDIDTGSGMVTVPAVFDWMVLALSVLIPASLARGTGSNVAEACG